MILSAIIICMLVINCAQTRVATELSLGELNEYVAYSKTINKFFDLLHEDFTCEYHTYSSYTIKDFQAEIEEIKNHYDQNFLQEIKLRGKGRTIYKQIDDSSWYGTNHTTLLATYIRNSQCPEEYDILYVKISQIKDINLPKLSVAVGATLAIAGLAFAAGPFGLTIIGAKTAVAAGTTMTVVGEAAIAAGTTTTVVGGAAIVGAKTAIIAATATIVGGGVGIAGKINSELLDMHDVAIGYAIYQMIQKKIFNIVNGQIYLQFSSISN